MKVEEKGHTTTIKNTQYNTAEFHQKFMKEYSSYKSQNLIIDLTHDESVSMIDIKLFLDLAKNHLKEKKASLDPHLKGLSNIVQILKIQF